MSSSSYCLDTKTNKNGIMDCWDGLAIPAVFARPWLADVEVRRADEFGHVNSMRHFEEDPGINVIVHVTRVF